MKPTIIFDLDGTLIDSAAAILESLELALFRAGLSPSIPLTPDLVGPPVREMVKRVIGHSQLNATETVLSIFKTVYDTRCLFNSPAFPGVDGMLRRLSLAGAEIFIATNKRDHPTRKILDYLGWLPFFRGVYSLDSIGIEACDKAALLGNIVQRHNLEPSSTVYIGDRNEDGEAAFVANGLRFLLAAWGYDGKRQLIGNGPWHLIERPDADAILRIFDGVTDQPRKSPRKVA